MRSTCTTLLAVTLLAASASAQIVTQSYRLDNVWLLPDITHPWEGAQPMTGSFDWTYVVGDFENGVASLTDLVVPWYGTDWSSLQIVADPASVEVTLPGNYHGLAVDITFFLAPLLSPSGASDIDPATSIFGIENGVLREGHVISGRIVPDPQLTLAVMGTCPDFTFDVAGAVPAGQVALLYAFGTGGFAVPSGKPCAGATLGLDASTSLARLLRADSGGFVSWSAAVPPGLCGRTYLQALDLASCGTSAVTLLP